MNAGEPTGPYDPLAKLYKQLEALRVAGARGEAVGEEIQELNRSIGTIIEQRQKAAQRREYDDDRGR